MDRHPRLDGYRQLVERFGEERVADAVLAKWLTDDAGNTGFERLAAMIGLHDHGARLKHFRDEDMSFDHQHQDSYVKPDWAVRRDARLRAETARRREEPAC